MTGGHLERVGEGLMGENRRGNQGGRIWEWVRMEKKGEVDDERESVRGPMRESRRGDGSDEAAVSIMLC